MLSSSLSAPSYKAAETFQLSGPPTVNRTWISVTCRRQGPLAAAGLCVVEVVALPRAAAAEVEAERRSDSIAASADAAAEIEAECRSASIAASADAAAEVEAECRSASIAASADADTEAAAAAAEVDEEDVPVEELVDGREQAEV